MGPGPWGAIIGAGVGLGKTYLVDAPKERRQRELAATMWRTSPWTGVRPEPVDETSAFNNVLQGGVQGLTFGANMDEAQKAQLLQNSLKGDQALNNIQIETGANPMSPGIASSYDNALSRPNPAMEGAGGSPWSLFRNRSSSPVRSNFGGL